MCLVNILENSNLKKCQQKDLKADIFVGKRNNSSDIKWPKQINKPFAANKTTKPDTFTMDVEKHVPC